MGLAVATVTTLGAAPAEAAVFSNGSGFDVNDGSGGSAPYTAGKGAKYPSTIDVAGLAGTVTDVNVILRDVSHTRPDDLDVMLVGPGGQRIVILSDSGETTPLSHADLTLDDEAAAPAPDITAMSTGSYRPTNNFGGFGEPPDGNDVFPAPAPGPPRAATLHEAFDGTDANGAWSLYVIDDRPGETGLLNGGWSVEITTTGPPAPPGTPPPPPPPPQPPPAIRASFAPVAPSDIERLHRSLTLDARSSVVGDASRARLAWDLNGDGRTDANCSGEQPQLVVHTVSPRFIGSSEQVSLTVSSAAAGGGPPVTSVVKQTVSFPARRAPGPRLARGAQLGVPDLAAQLDALNQQMVDAQKTGTFVCDAGSDARVGDLTANGGPGPGCGVTVQSGIIDATGCLERVATLSDLPARELALVRTLVKTPYAPFGRARSAAGPLSRFATNPYGRVDLPSAVVASRVPALVREQDPFVSRQPVRINGVDFVPRPGAAIVVYPLEDLIVSSKAVVSVGGGSLYAGEIAWRLPDARNNHLGDFDVPATLGNTVGGLRVKGTVGLDFGPRVATLPMNVTLPSELGDLNQNPITGAMKLQLDNAHGLDPNGTTMYVAYGRVGGVQTTGETMRYDGGARTWQGDTQVLVPPAGLAPAQLGLRDGRFDFLRAHSGPFVAGGGLGFDSLDLHDVRTSNGIALTGAQSLRTIGALPFFGATCPIARSSSPGTLRGNFSGSTFEVTGPIEILCLPVPDGRITVNQSGFIEATGLLRKDLLPRIISIEMPLRGRIDYPRFQANGTARACLNIILKICKGADAVVSDTGIGACTDVGLPGVLGFVSVRIGGGIQFGPPPRTRVFEASCDLAGFSSFRAARTAGGGRALRFPPGLKAALVEVSGADGAPSITLTGPKGRRLVTPPSGHAEGSGGYVLDRDADSKTTYVLIGHPGGAWTIAADSGSPAISQVRSAGSLPQASVSARVLGSGTRRSLAYRIRTIPGQRVRFSEVGAGSGRDLGTVTRARGTLRFSPAAGPVGPRRIEATIEQGGFPREVVTVAKYRAVPARPGRPRGVSVRRRGGAVIVRWRRIGGASRYRVLATLSDGRRQLLVVRGITATLAGVPPSGRGTIVVSAVDGAGQAGPTAGVRLKATPRPRPRLR